MLDKILNLWENIEKNNTQGVSLPLWGVSLPLWEGYTFFKDCEEVRELRTLLKEYLLYDADINNKQDIMMLLKRPSQYSLKKNGISVQFKVQVALPRFKYICAVIKDDTKYGIIL